MLLLFETAAGFALFKVLKPDKLKDCEDLSEDFASLDSAQKVGGLSKRSVLPCTSVTIRRDGVGISQTEAASLCGFLLPLLLLLPGQAIPSLKGNGPTLCSWDRLSSSRASASLRTLRRHWPPLPPSATPSSAKVFWGHHTLHSVSSTACTAWRLPQSLS
jgi:hypothetical protein